MNLPIISNGGVVGDIEVLELEIVVGDLVVVVVVLMPVVGSNID